MTTTVDKMLRETVISKWKSIIKRDGVNQKPVSHILFSFVIILCTFVHNVDGKTFF